MNRFMVKAILFASCLCLSASVLANKDHGMKGKKWMCATNASSASTEGDKRADDMMSKKAMSAKDAFSFAYKHCRDCTKITCSIAESDNSNTNNAPPPQ